MRSFNLKNLFKRKPRLDHAEASIRLAAVAALDDEQDVLGRVFREDESRDVRLAALGRLTDASVIATGLDDPDVQADAAHRLLALGSELPDHIRAHVAVARVELSEAQDETRAARAAARIDDPDQRLAALLKNPSNRIRAAVMEGVWDVEVLALVERASRGRDKGLYRMARERIAERRKGQAEREAEQGESERLCSAAAQIADDDAHYDAKRDAIEREWQQMLQSVQETDAGLARFGVPPRDLESLQDAFPARRVRQVREEPPVAGAEAEVPADAGPPAEPAPTERVEALIEQADELVVGGVLTADSVASLRAALEALQPASEPAPPVEPKPAPGDDREASPEAGAQEGLTIVATAAMADSQSPPEADPEREVRDPEHVASAERPGAMARQTRAASAPRPAETRGPLMEPPPTVPEPPAAPAASMASPEGLPGEAAEQADDGYIRALRKASERVAAIERAVELEARASDLVARSLPPEAEDESWQALSERLGATHELRREARALQRRYGWPRDMPRPAQLEGLTNALTQADAAIASAGQRLQGLAEEVADILGKFETAIGDGSVRAASEHEHAARDLVPFLPRDRARSLQARLGSLSARLRELRDWRTFAESPKREGLCQRMEELAEQPLAPQPQADEVKSLRAQWNELGRVASHRDRELLARFDDAAERAFEPCRAHFAELAERRAYNLEQRRAIVDVLEDYVAGERWQSSDWTGVERVLRTARSEWRGYYPVDRRAGREVEARFNELTATIHDHLKSEWDVNSARLESIVAEAAAARASDAPLPERIEVLKSLQQQWKESGPVPRRVSQRLWRQFRDECDPVFAEREAVREDRAEQFRRSTDEAERLIDELRALVDSTSPLDEREVANLRTRTASIGQLPRRLLRRLDEALADVERALSAQRAASTRESELAWLARVEEVDRAFAEAAAGDELEAWRDAAGEFAALFAARFEDDADEEDEDPHQLTIVSEIEAETPSPEADQNLRLALSIERLNGDLSGEREASMDHRSLALRWCAAPATAEEELRTRFFGALRSMVAGHVSARGYTNARGPRVN